MGRWLVLGGTRFLSHAVAAAAVARGHEVVCAARGTSGSVPPGAVLVPVDRDVSLDGIGGSFDAVVDVARMSHPWVTAALDELADRAGHWTFVSSISAYADQSDPRSALLPPDPDGGYGEVKVACEEAVRAVRGENALIVRAGLICGPGDLSDRFGYWPVRFARGGRAAVPAVDHPLQIVDVRDLAEWIVRCGEDCVNGTVDGVGPRSTLGTVLDEIATAVGAPGLARVPVAPDALRAAGIEEWMGERSLPLWLPDDHRGMADHDPSPAAAAGLTCRPVADTARDALAYERTLDPVRTRAAGITVEVEDALLG